MKRLLITLTATSLAIGCCLATASSQNPSACQVPPDPKINCAEPFISTAVKSNGTAKK